MRFHAPQERTKSSGLVPSSKSRISRIHPLRPLSRLSHPRANGEILKCSSYLWSQSPSYFHIQQLPNLRIKIDRPQQLSVAYECRTNTAYACSTREKLDVLLQCEYEVFQPLSLIRGIENDIVVSSFEANCKQRTSPKTNRVSSEGEQLEDVVGASDRITLCENTYGLSLASSL